MGFQLTSLYGHGLLTTIQQLVEGCWDISPKFPKHMESNIMNFCYRQSTYEDVHCNSIGGQRPLGELPEHYFAWQRSLVGKTRSVQMRWVKDDRNQRFLAIRSYSNCLTTASFQITHSVIALVFLIRQYALKWRTSNRVGDYDRCVSRFVIFLSSIRFYP